MTVKEGNAERKQVDLLQTIGFLSEECAGVRAATDSELNPFLTMLCRYCQALVYIDTDSESARECYLKLQKFCLWMTMQPEAVGTSISLFARFVNEVRELIETGKELSSEVMEELDGVLESVEVPEELLNKKYSSCEPREKTQEELKILVVEDNLVNQKVIGKMLSSYGSCDFAQDGKQGLLHFLASLEDSNPYDLVMLDIMMPHLDGQGLLRLIRLCESEHEIFGKDGVKIIMTTALDDGKNILGAFREGCEGYLIKPIEREEMHKIMKKLDMSPQASDVSN